MKSLIVLFKVGIGLGIVLLVLSYSWLWLFPLNRQWTSADQKKLEEAALQYHRLTYKAPEARKSGNQDAGRLEADFRHWREEYEKNNAKLIAITGMNAILVKFFYYSGMAVLSLSVLGLLRFRGGEATETVESV